MRKAAVIVGVRDYQDEDISQVPFAANDATKLAECLRERCGFDDVRLLTHGSPDGEPEVHAVYRAFREFSVRLRSSDLFLFYFAGHAVEFGDETHLLTRQSIWDEPSAVGLKLRRLMRMLGRMEAGQRAILMDGCRNSPERARGDPGNSMGPIVARDLKVLARGTTTTATNVAATTCLLTACAQGERAYEWRERQHGAFTHFLLEGIRETGWKNGELDFRILAEHVIAEVQRWSKLHPGIKQKQTPMFETYGPGRVLLAGTAAPQSAEPKVASRRALLRWRDLGQHRSLFVTSRPEVLFGRGSDANAFVVRWIPCQSPSTDPEHWRRNLVIGRKHLVLTLAPEGATLAPGSPRALTMVQSRGRLRQLLGGGTMGLTDGSRLWLGPESEDHQTGLELHARCVKDAAGHLTAVHLERVANGGRHSYLAIRDKTPLGPDGAGLPGLPRGLVIAPSGRSLTLATADGSAPSDLGLEFRSVTLDDFKTP